MNPEFQRKRQNLVGPKPVLDAAVLMGFPTVILRAVLTSFLHSWLSAGCLSPPGRTFLKRHPLLDAAGLPHTCPILPPYCPGRPRRGKLQLPRSLQALMCLPGSVPFLENVLPPWPGDFSTPPSEPAGLSPPCTLSPPPFCSQGICIFLSVTQTLVISCVSIPIGPCHILQGNRSPWPSPVLGSSKSSMVRDQ